MKPLTLLLPLLLLGAAVVHAQSLDISQSSFSPEQLSNRTGFELPNCVPDENYYTYKIINALPATVEFTVLLYCRGVPVNGDTVTVPPGSISRDLPISPSLGNVRNTPCSLALEAPDPFDSDPNAPRRRYATFNSTCGGVELDDDDSCSGDEDDDCSFPDFPCQLETGTWYHSWMSQAIFYTIALLAGIAVVFIIKLCFFTDPIKADEIAENSSHWRREIRKMQEANGYQPSAPASTNGKGRASSGKGRASNGGGRAGSRSKSRARRRAATTDRDDDGFVAIKMHTFSATAGDEDMDGAQVGGLAYAMDDMDDF